MAKYVTTRYRANACFMAGSVLSALGLIITSHSQSTFDFYLFYSLMVGIGLSFVYTATIMDTPS